MALDDTSDTNEEKQYTRENKIGQQLLRYIRRNETPNFLQMIETIVKRNKNIKKIETTNGLTYDFNYIMNRFIEHDTGNPLIIVASIMNNDKIVSKLIELGANTNMKNLNNETAINYAILNNNIWMIELLMRPETNIASSTPKKSALSAKLKRKKHSFKWDRLMSHTSNTDHGHDAQSH